MCNTEKKIHAERRETKNQARGKKTAVQISNFNFPFSICKFYIMNKSEFEIIIIFNL